MANPLEHELLRHSQALRQLARALVGAGNADDLVQAAGVEVLAAPIDARAPVPLLRQILRRLASKHHRGERRRRARETAALPPGAPEPPERAASHKETVQRLHQALMAVPEPQLGTLLLRYFEDLPPTVIAARLAVPLPTVKSRLLRGLVLLREQLDRDGIGADWRAGLVAAFGIDASAAAASLLPAAAGLTLALTMKALLAAAAIAIAALALFLFARTTASPNAPHARVEQVVAPAVAAPATQGSGNQAVATFPTEVRTEVRAATLAPTLGTVRGRLVDEGGMPLADGVIRMLARGTPEHGSELAQGSSGSDGTFAITELAVDQELRAHVAIANRIPMQSMGIRFDAATTHDFGDIVLRAGAVVRGRVVDRDGVPIASVEVLDQVQGNPPQGAFYWCKGRAVTGVDGRFDLGALSAREHSLQVPSEQMLAAVTLQLEHGQPPIDIEIRVEAAARQASLRGIVVDAGGRGVANATVLASEQSPQGLAFRTTTAPDGTFVLRRLSDAPPHPAMLGAIAAGCDEAILGDPCTWGTTGLRVELSGLSQLTLRAVTNDGAAIEDYRVRLQRLRGTALARNHFDGFPPHAETHHPDGRYTVSGLHRGDYDLHLEPLDQTFAPSPVLRLTVGDNDAMWIVALQRSVARTVHIVTRDGQPIAGCRLELCQPYTGPIDLGRGYVVPLAEWTNYQVTPKALQLQVEATDAAGTTTLRGPSSTPLVLRVLGPGCLPAALPLERLDGEGELRFSMATGGNLQVRATPADVLPMLVALGAPTGLVLTRRVGNIRERIPTSLMESLPFAADGTLELAGVGPGTWTATLEHEQGRRTLGDVRIDDGATTTFAVDLAPLRPGELRGSARVNGQALRRQSITLEWDDAPGEPSSGRWNHGRSLELDGDGRFHFRGIPGNYRVLVPTDARTRNNRMEPAMVTLTAGGATDQAFTLTTGTLSLRFVDAEQRPVAGVEMLQLRRAPMDYSANLAATDAEGRVTLENCEIGDLLLSVFPHRLGSMEVQLELIAKSPNEPDIVDRERIELGIVHVRSGAPIEQTLVLPASYFR